MPILPENKLRYPKGWPEISRYIRFERAGGRCEWPGCDAENGLPHPETGSTVVLTCAHLGLPAQLPFFLHVARFAGTDKVIDLVGIFVPLDAEAPEWRSMMYSRSASEFFRGPPAVGAGFLVALPSGPSGLAPTRTIILGSTSTTPIWVRLTNWGLLGKPLEAADVSAKSAPPFDVEMTCPVGFTAPLADGFSKTALASAYAFTATGVRTSSLAVGSLLRRQSEALSADDAVTLLGAFPGPGHGLLYHISEYPENCSEENLLALCQKHHLAYDAEHHRQTRRKRRAVADLFATPEG